MDQCRSLLPIVSADGHRQLVPHSEVLWKEVANAVPRTGGVLVVDDSTLDKPYFIKHRKRLAYKERLQKGQAIGSGMVEGQAKTLGLRLKLRGARRNTINVRPMASLICVRNSKQWDNYWNMAV